MMSNDAPAAAMDVNPESLEPRWARGVQSASAFVGGEAPQPLPTEAEAMALDDEQAIAQYSRQDEETGETVSVLAIEGMHCAACSLNLESALIAVPGVRQVEVHGVTHKATIHWMPSDAKTRPSDWVAVIARAGYRAHPAMSAKAEHGRRMEGRRSVWRSFVSGFCMMQVMMYSVPLYYATELDMSADIRQLMLWASWILTIPVLLFAAGPLIAGAWQDVRHRRIGMDVPVALGVVVTFVVSTGAAFDPGGLFGHEVYFDSLTMFVFFLLLGRQLELKARDRSAGILESLMGRLPETVLRETADGELERVPMSRLAVGDRIHIGAGAAVPADGVLLSEAAQVDEALLTGESRPVPKRQGDPLMAGGFNLSHGVRLEVTRLGSQTRFAAIVALMTRAQSEKPPFVRAMDKAAKPFLWGVLIVAALGGMAWSFIQPDRAVWVMVSVLIVTCPCAFSLATPSALLTAAGVLARRGVLAQRLQALELLQRIDTVILDKTGTVTEDRLKIEGMDAWLAEVDGVAVQAWVASLAAGSLHPVARALANLGQGLPQLPAFEALSERAGQGLEARDARGRTWRLGRASFALTVDMPSDAPAWSGSEVWLGLDGQPVARWRLAEWLREDAREAVAQMQAEGLSVHLMSGDRPSAVQAVAAELGIAQWHGALTPEDKLALTQSLQAQGHQVLMVGDGLNDGPVMAKADIAVAVGVAAPLVRSKADFTVLSSRLGEIPRMRALSRQTLRILRQNLAWSAVYNFACVPLALMGWLPPWAAGLGMAGSSLAVVLNAQRLVRWDRRQQAHVSADSAQGAH